jgi:hypothetical protein
MQQNGDTKLSSPKILAELVHAISARWSAWDAARVEAQQAFKGR